MAKLSWQWNGRQTGNVALALWGDGVVRDATQRESHHCFEMVGSMLEQRLCLMTHRLYMDGSVSLCPKWV